METAGARHSAPRLTYRPGLDGVRAIAVSGVVLYHAGVSWMPGGFLGVASHDVAIPVNQFTQSDGKLVLAGATKEAIKAMPPFEYAHR